VADVAGDPLAQWQRWYADASAAGVTEPNAMTVATVGLDGHLRRRVPPPGDEERRAPATAVQSGRDPGRSIVVVGNRLDHPQEGHGQDSVAERFVGAGGYQGHHHQPY
jgi:hypothetical protein